MHYYDGVNGIKDFDVWFFYPFNQKHLPYRTIWNWDYKNPKFGRHPSIPGYTGRKVDVLVRSVKNYTQNDPVKTIHQFLQYENTASSKELAKKAVVMLAPEALLGKVVWYKQKKYNKALQRTVKPAASLWVCHPLSLVVMRPERAQDHANLNKWWRS